MTATTVLVGTVLTVCRYFFETAPENAAKIDLICHSLPATLPSHHPIQPSSRLITAKLAVAAQRCEQERRIPPTEKRIKRWLQL